VFRFGHEVDLMSALKRLPSPCVELRVVRLAEADHVVEIPASSTSRLYVVALHGVAAEDSHDAARESGELL
jgi:hypothetical protein